MLRGGCQCMTNVGNVWCPWEVGPSKDGCAGSNPVTSELSPHLRHFFCVFLRPNTKNESLTLKMSN